MKVLVVYDTATKALKRWVIPDHESELNDVRHVQEDESSRIIEVEDPHSLHQSDVIRACDLN